MTRTSVAILSIVLLFACKPAGKPTTWATESDAIKTVMNKQAEDWNKGSVDNFMKGYWHSDSLQFITKRGVTKDWDTICNHYKKFYNTREKMGHLDFSNLIVTPLDSPYTLAQVTGKWRVEQKDTQQGCFSLVFKKFDTQWRIIIDHTW